MHAAAKLKKLEERYEGTEPTALLRALIEDEFPGKIALVSSFGIEAGLLLAMVAEIDPATPVIFLDTHKLFPETLEYRETLTEHFRLTNVLVYHPDYNDVSRDDPDGMMYQKNPNGCCYIRKVKPMNRALKPYDAWITGRKRYHGGLREDLPLLEVQDGRIKCNPLAAWDAAQIRDEYEHRGIPPHPLSDTYPSVGCVPCTDLPDDPNDVRSGRWVGRDKTECGIHIGADGKFHRGPG